MNSCRPNTTSRASRVDEMWRIAPAGDRALLITIGTVIDPALLGEVLALDRALQDRRPAGLLGTVPAYGSLLCHYDAGVTDAARLEESIRQLEGKIEPAIPSGAIVGIPTRYDGPDLPEVAPRLASPRLRVPAGSVGIAGRQTGIYAVDSPGGWNLIGRTTLRLFEPKDDPPARFKPGDRLRFIPIP